jgi:hypothetical protein
VHNIEYAVDVLTKAKADAEAALAAFGKAGGEGKPGNGKK